MENEGIAHCAMIEFHRRAAPQFSIFHFQFSILKGLAMSYIAIVDYGAGNLMSVHNTPDYLRL